MALGSIQRQGMLMGQILFGIIIYGTILAVFDILAVRTKTIKLPGWLTRQQGLRICRYQNMGLGECLMRNCYELKSRLLNEAIGYLRKPLGFLSGGMDSR